MRILHITRNIPIKELPGNTIILDLMDQLENKNVEQKIIFPAEFIPSFPWLRGRAKIFSKFRGESTIRNKQLYFLNFLRLPGKYSFILARVFYKNKKIKRFIDDIDCIHAHYILPDGLIANNLARIKKLPYVITVRQGDIDRINKLSSKSFILDSYKKVLLEASEVISVNYSIKYFLLNKFNIHSKIIPHAVDKAIIQYKNDVSNNNINIITSAQFIKRKNIDWVINSCKLISDKYNFKFHLTIVGEGPLDSYLRGLAAESNNIEIIGWLSKNKLLSKFAGSDVFIMPSENETFGMVFIEAAAKNCLIIGKKGTGVDGYFENQKNAYFINSQTELTSILLEILSGKINFREISKLGTKLVETTMTWDAITEQYIEIYKRVCRNA
ncbi:MAG: glycosyltransferase family 4 protein [Enterobacteriaceae bacterium]|nr:glycosyltransferase family 4 protein [Enterobacteriaceae bacterium]